MPPRKKTEEIQARTPPRPATTPEIREQQLVAAAVELAEKQILAGTASSQVLVHYLKLGSTRERLEQQRLTQENRLTEAKIEQIAAAARVEELYKEAMKVFTSYSGQQSLEMPEDDYDE